MLILSNIGLRQQSEGHFTSRVQFRRKKNRFPLELIAYEWGKKKNRKAPEKMTYENMSRGMRQSRVASDYFRVPDKKWKKKFVYQFGEKAIESCQFLKDCKNGIVPSS